MRERLARIPGVETVAAAATVPFGMVSLGQRVVDSAAPPPTGDERPGVSATFNIVTGDYCRGSPFAGMFKTPRSPWKSAP